MTTYAVGDIQGCYDALQRLLEKIRFNPAEDVLWVAGDLVSRGEDSLAVLRLLKELGDAVVCVLGNHDVSLIAAHYGVMKVHPSLDSIMNAPDRFELIDWLRAQPLVAVDKQRKLCMIHAGLLPGWSVKKAARYSREIEEKLRGEAVGPWLRRVYGNKPNRWNSKLSGDDRDRFILNALTRMRFLHKNGALQFTSKVSPANNKKLIPWFQSPRRKSLKYTIVFGHWASLGYYHGKGVIGLDSGCVWGNALTAVNLDKPPDSIQPIRVKCR